MPFTFIDLFAGIGGTRLAFESVGGSCVFTAEWDKDAIKTYKDNFQQRTNDEIKVTDITKVKAASLPDFTVLLAGFPCQPFSSIGQRQGFMHKTQGTLFYDVLRILRAKRPAAFLLENVVGLVNHDGGNTFAVILQSLNKLGYSVHHAILDAADYGVPQHRKRIYIVGYDKKKLIRGINHQWPNKSRTNAVIGRIHDRMPVMLNTLEERAAWLNERTPIAEIRSLLDPAPDALVLSRRVSRAVSNARNEGPRLLEEIPDESVGLGL